MEKLTPEEKLLKAIFDDSRNEPIKEVDTEDCDDDYDENYPDTNAEKIGYATYALTKSLEYISKALIRLNRLNTLYKVSNNGVELPEIIQHNECRMALENLNLVRGNILDVYKEVADVYKNTSEGENK